MAGNIRIWTLSWMRMLICDQFPLHDHIKQHHKAYPNKRESTSKLTCQKQKTVASLLWLMLLLPRSFWSRGHDHGLAGGWEAEVADWGAGAAADGLLVLILPVNLLRPEQTMLPYFSKLTSKDNKHFENIILAKEEHLFYKSIFYNLFSFF